MIGICGEKEKEEGKGEAGTVSIASRIVALLLLVVVIIVVIEDGSSSRWRNF